jgi:hypothetical protein
MLDLGSDRKARWLEQLEEPVFESGTQTQEEVNDILARWNLLAGIKREAKDVPEM